MPVPDYRGGSIVNLMASLVEGLGGGASIHPPLAWLPPDEIARHRCVVLLVFDGLGQAQLTAQAPGGALVRALRARLTSVFPSTTATAVTSFLTGDAPRQHGLTGWHMYLRELGTVLAVLPGQPRFGGPALAEVGIGAARLYGHRPVFERLSGRSCVISPAYIAYSDFNRAHAGGAEIRAYDSLEQFFAIVAQAVTDNRFQYVYGYCSALDAIGHSRGPGSVAAKELLQQMDRGFDRLGERLHGSRTLLLATADHGQIETHADDRIGLGAHPDLARTLALPLCGEPRAAFCYVRAGAGADFEAYVGERLSHCAELRHSEELVESGLFGQGPSHPRLQDRIGDYCLLMKQHYVIKDWLAFERRYEQVGVHGGLSPEELYVPLAAVSC